MTRCFVLSVLVPAVLAAQQPTAVTLKPADGTVAAGFTNVSSMQEIKDGRVIMSDQTSRIFGIGDFATGKFAAIENVNPGRITRLAADTTLLAGGTQAQWVFLVGGTPIGMLGADNPVVTLTRSFWGADSLGRVLATARSPIHEDSVHEILVTRATAAVDTVASLWQGPEVLSDDKRPFYSAYEHADLALDGWVSVLRTAPYRVDWRSPDGRWTLGKPIPYQEVKFDDREKLFVMQQRARTGAPESPSTVKNWPASIAPWTSTTPIGLSPDGKLLVRRVPSADFPDPRYDVINRRGEVERQIVLGPNERILGFGEKSVYVIVTAKDRSQSVQRHPWP